MERIFTYRQFDRALAQVERIWNLNMSISDLFRDYNREAKDEGSIYFPDSSTEIISLLETILNDTSGWISYWAWELNFGKEYECGSITDTDGTNIPLKTRDDLWNVLIREYPNVNPEILQSGDLKKCYIDLSGKVGLSV